MASFIELPRLSFDGRDLPSWYVNTADIITLDEKFDGTTNVLVRNLGNEGMAAHVVTYAPIMPLLDLLGELSARPGVRSWSDVVKHAWSVPIAARLKEAAARERDAYRRGDVHVAS